jgi:excisionase family DNA binding protein
MTNLADYVTVAEGASMLGLSVGTLYTRIHDGLLPAVRVGDRKTLIHRADVERQIERVKPHGN